MVPVKDPPSGGLPWQGDPPDSEGMKIRYLIEADSRYGADGFTISELQPGDDDGRASGFYATVDEAKAYIAQHFSQQGYDDPPKWKDVPEAWKPHAITVTQYVDDGIEPNVL